MARIIIAFALYSLFFFFVAAVCISLYGSRKRGAPFGPTPARAIREALRAAELRPGEIFCDLGAGTGKALIIAAREFGARAKGFEISWIFYSIARTNLFVRRTHAALEKKDLFTQDLSGADVIFSFLAIRSMKRVEEQIKRQAKPGARIIAYTFPPPTMIPEKIIPVHGEWKLYLYRIPAQ